MVLFSFIIPVYNAEATLEKCIDSIIARKTPDYEVLLIDDESKDRSNEICQEYAKKYEQVSVYRFPNAGAGAARNRGIERAKGEYILFCDSDDWYDSEKLNTLLDSAPEHMKNTDLLCFDFRRVWSDFFEEQQNIKAAPITFQTKGDAMNFVSCSEMSRHISIIVWNKIFNRRIILDNQITFAERNALKNKDDWAEDLTFVANYVLAVHNIQTVLTPIYFNAMRGLHGTVDNKYASTNRIAHMTRMLMHLYHSPVCQNQGFSQSFSEFFIYHIHNYLFEYIQKNGHRECRRVILKDPTGAFIQEQIRNILKSWKSYAPSRWGSSAQTYRNILSYILSGRELLYKLRCKLSEKSHS